MKDLIVVSYATHRAGLLDEYEQQLKDAEIDFHLEPVELADGINSVTARWKFEYMRRMCEKFADYERIVFTDAWDVLYEEQDHAHTLASIPRTMLVSSERNCFPEDWIAPLRDDSRYINAGMIAGRPAFIGAWSRFQLSDRPEHELSLMEQAWFNRALVRGNVNFLFDWNDGLFFTALDGIEWFRDLEWKPSFFHFSGKCPTAPFRAMLRGEIPSL